jgi:hypothetical protein
VNLLGIVRINPVEETERKVEHVRSGLFDCEPCGAGKGAEKAFKLLWVLECLDVPIAVPPFELAAKLRRVRQIERRVDAKGFRVLDRRWVPKPIYLLIRPCSDPQASWSRHRLEEKLPSVGQRVEELIRKLIDNSKRSLPSVSVVKKTIALGEIQQPSAHALKAIFHVAVKKVRVLALDVRWLTRLLVF